MNHGPLIKEQLHNDSLNYIKKKNIQADVCDACQY